jgi:hypothetical protein
MSGVAEPGRGGGSTATKAPPSPIFGAEGVAAAGTPIFGTILMGGTTGGPVGAAPSFSGPNVSPSFGTVGSVESVGGMDGSGPSARVRPPSSDVCSSESRKLPSRGVPACAPCRGVPSPGAATGYALPSYHRGVAGDPPRGVVSTDRGVPPVLGVPGGRGVRFGGGAAPSAPSIVTRGVAGLTPRVLPPPAVDPSDARASPSLPLPPKRGVLPRGVPKRTSERGVLVPIGSKRGVPAVGVPGRIGAPRSAGTLGADRSGGSRGDAPTKPSSDARGVKLPAAPAPVRGVPAVVRGVVPRDSGELPRGVALRSGSVDAHRISTRGECGFNRKGGTGGAGAGGSAGVGRVSGALPLEGSVTAAAAAAAAAALVAASSDSRMGRLVSLNEKAGRVGGGGGDISSSDDDEDEPSSPSELWWSESWPILHTRMLALVALSVSPKPSMQHCRRVHRSWQKACAAPWTWADGGAEDRLTADRA